MAGSAHIKMLLIGNWKLKVDLQTIFGIYVDVDPNYQQGKYFYIYSKHKNNCSCDNYIWLHQVVGERVYDSQGAELGLDKDEFDDQYAEYIPSRVSDLFQIRVETLNRDKN